MYDWKFQVIDQAQALTEFKQCLKYYSRNEDVIVFEYSQLVDEQTFDRYGEEKTIEYAKKDMVEKISSEILAKECFHFEEVPYHNQYQLMESYRQFRIKIEAIIQKKGS